MILSQRPRAVAAASLAGAAAGAVLTAAEVHCAAVLGSPLSPGLWGFLAAYYVPAGALAAALAEATLFAKRAPEQAAARALSWLLPLVAAVYAVAIVNQNLLRGRAWGAAARLAVSLPAVAAVAGLAAWVERRLRRGPAGGALHAAGVRLLAFACFLALVHHGLARFGEAPPLRAALVLPVAAAGMTATLALAVAAVRSGSVAPVLCALAVAGALAHGVRDWRARSAARLRDQPQPGQAASGPDRPNVVLVVIDTVRAGHLSSYGYARRTTPHLDALAAQGVRHTNATTPYGWSLAAHASLFTGLFPREHGVGLRAEGRSATVLHPRHVTLAETLAEAGYATAGISANPLVSRAFGLDQGFRYFHAGGPSTVHARAHPLLRRIENRVWPEAFRRHLRERFRLRFPSASDVTDEALAWLARPRARPFLLFLNYMDAHTPRFPRPGHSDRWPAPDGREDLLPAWAQREEPGRPLTPRQREDLVRYYDGALSYVDAEFGRLMRGVDALPGRDRTWVIVVSDHGEMLGEHGRFGHHCNVYEELLRVPLVMRHPRGSGPPPGTVDTAPIQLTDVAPRVLAALGLGRQPPAPRPAPAMLGLFVCSCGPVHAALHGDTQETIIEGGLKYVEEQGRPPLLFDLARDPGEASDLHDQRPDDARALRARLDHWRAALRPVSPPALDPESAREREEALRALGYIQ